MARRLLGTALDEDSQPCRPGTALDETDVGGGVAFWPYEHNSNLKAFYTRVIPSDSSLGFDQLNVQWQLAFY